MPSASPSSLHCAGSNSASKSCVALDNAVVNITCKTERAAQYWRDRPGVQECDLQGGSSRHARVESRHWGPSGQGRRRTARSASLSWRREARAASIAAIRRSSTADASTRASSCMFRRPRRVSSSGFAMAWFASSAAMRSTVTSDAAACAISAAASSSAAAASPRAAASSAFSSELSPSLAGEAPCPPLGAPDAAALPPSAPSPLALSLVVRNHRASAAAAIP
mmetsp:Transcript_20377/g.39015  ORF Transcript_20377/g.39015 Transcript_20377/m.39015 type:complete len:223 (-) Transcript_20377:822-1490(-)